MSIKNKKVEGIRKTLKVEWNLGIAGLDHPACVFR
jgi:hypothetical protein